MTGRASLFEVVRKATVDLRAVGAAPALVGGLAVGVHVLERATRDADFAVAVADDAVAERITTDLVARGYVLALALEQIDTGRLATVRLASPLDGHTLVDLLYASSGIEAEIVGEAVAMDVGDGVVVPVARRGHLVALKILARSERRPQDDQDLGALLRGIDVVELERARAALARIAERGFARGKSLAAELDAQLARWNASR